MINFEKAGEKIWESYGHWGRYCLTKFLYIFLMLENFQLKEGRNTSPYVYLYIKLQSKETGKLLKMSLTNIQVLFVLR